MKKDVFKIDNYLITIGVLFLAIGLATILLDPFTYIDVDLTEIKEGDSANSNDKKSLETEAIINKKVKEKPIKRLIMAISGLLLLIVGIYYRKKENKIHSIWDALERTKEGKLRDLEVSLGLSRSFILDNLKHINAQLGAYYVYISAKDLIVDGRLMEEHTLSVTCTGCGNAIKQKVSLANLDKPSCSYCGAPIPVAELSKLKKGVVNEFVWDNTSQKKEFNVVIFVVLLVVFWPAALGYMAYKKNLASQENLQKLSKFAVDVKKANT